MTPTAARVASDEWKRRWSTPACQIEIVYGSLERDVRSWIAAARIDYEAGAGVRSNGPSAATYLCMGEDDAAAVREAFADRLAQQRLDFKLKDFE